jgi:CTP:molybdopterin cytidylyltransferase MocA
MLAAALAPILASAAAGTVVVTRKEIAAGLIAGLPSGPAAPLGFAFNEAPEAQMIDSVRLGIAEWERRVHPGPRDGYLVVPGDLPGLPSEVVARCIETFVADPSRIVVASHRGKTGHPMIFPQPLTPFVRSRECDGGLTRLKQHHAGLLSIVESDSAAVLRNINTPEDLKSL